MMKLLSVFILFAMGVWCLLLLRKEGLLPKPRFLFASAVCIALAFVLRGLCLSHETLDYQNFLVKWVEHFRVNGGFRGIASYKGNYNIPYLYFLAAFSYSKAAPLHWIKLLSVFFDVLLAWGAERLVFRFGLSERRRRAAFLVTLLLPTVLLNGAYWGQCDSIYVALAVWSLYWMLSDRPCLSMLFLALSFSFKLQAIFFIPVYFLFLTGKRLKWWQLLVFPLTYAVVVLPAVALGKPFTETLTLYLNQTGSIGSGLNYNSPSLFALWRPENADSAAKLAIAAAFLFILFIYVLLARRSARADKRLFLTAALLLVIVIPFLLPHMHDRYFFGADALSLAAALVMPQLFPVPVLCSFASLLGYYAYLRGHYLLPMSAGTVALIVAIVWVFAELIFQAFPASVGRRRKKA